MAHEYYPIQGIKDGVGPDGRVPIRREFNDWSQSRDPAAKNQVVLFVLALEHFQKMDPKERDSYFQIAGIHGMPYTSWDEPDVTAKEVHRKGYCVHANCLFPLWHRPYLLLYEQRIYDIMVDIIIPGLQVSRKIKDVFRKAASTWRLPYWDWAKEPKIPKLLCRPKLKINVAGKETKMDNPLFKFRMPEGQKMGEFEVELLKSPEFDDPLYVWFHNVRLSSFNSLTVRSSPQYGECIATSRCPTKEQRDPTSEAWRHGVVNTEQVNDFLGQHASITDLDYGDTAEMVYRLLTYPMDFVSFATTARDANMVSASASKVTNDMNIEFIHNNIHYWVGGDGGHMSQIPVATFDPVFWFHHCNLDRLFAIWQTLNPEQWFDADKTRPFDQKVIGMGNIITNQTPFRPFHKDKIGTLWTADDARSWFQLGYTYPELQRWEYGPDHNHKAKLLEYINNAYGVTRKQAFQLATPDNKYSGVIKMKENGVAIKDYAVSIRYSKFAMGGYPFNLEVYLRPEGETDNECRSEDFVTSVYNFSQPAEQNGETVCSNCRDLEQQDVKVTAYIPLTSYLIKKIQQQQLDSLEPVAVEKFLQGIYWRMTMVGEEISESKWKDKMNLHVEISVTEMSYPTDPQATPDFEEPETIPSLGTGGAAPIPQVPPSHMVEPVSVGGSIIIKAPFIKLDIPRQRTEAGIDLLYLDSSTGNASDEESFDVPLQMSINRVDRVLECKGKRAHRGYSGRTLLKPEPWFEANDPTIRVDIGADEFVVYINGRKIGAVRRTIQTDTITHVNYWTIFPKTPRVLGDKIAVTTYKQASLVR
ncbi:common central domain of tyrosinase-domain-containing protein [Aspergillus cavernicola]|uniref:tyrosinase n=1 Tax=Aspergillus cavernicola TaxID=176166 RepID=A0ABR4IDY3_9EURO